MGTYILRRLLITIPLLFGMTFVIFMIIQLAPGNFFDQWALMPEINQRQLRQMKRNAGADKPVLIQYTRWLQGVLFDLRFSSPRRRIADFEYGTNVPNQKENKTKYELGGTARPYVFKVARDNSFAGAFSFDEAGQEGVIGMWDNASQSSETPSESWSTDEFKALEFDIEVVGFDGADLFLRVPDSNRKAYLEKRFVSHEGLTIDLNAELFQRFDVDSSTLQPINLFLTSNRGVPTEARIEFLKSGNVVSTKTATLLAQERNTVLKKELPEGISNMGEVDQIRFSFTEAKLEPVGVTCRVKDGSGKIFEQPISLQPGVPQSIYIPFGDLSAAGINLLEVDSISFVTDAKADVMVDEVRLVHNVAALGVGTPNFGLSMRTQEPVWDVMIPKLKNTILLNIFGLIFTWVLALPIGIYSATHPYSWGDKIIGFLAYIGMALPAFFLALLMLYLVSLTYDFSPDNPFREILPIGGLTSNAYDDMSTGGKMWDIAQHLFLPVLVLGTGGMAGLVRVLRANFLEESQKQFVVTARAKGLSEKLINYKHVLRNAIMPFVASFGSILPAMLGGSALVEIIFSYPGIGSLMLGAVRSYDIYLVMANAFVGAFLLIIGNILADILLAWVDPRISYQ